MWFDSPSEARLRRLSSDYHCSDATLLDFIKSCGVARLSKDFDIDKALRRTPDVCRFSLLSTYALQQRHIDKLVASDKKQLALFVYSICLNGKVAGCILVTERMLFFLLLTHATSEGNQYTAYTSIDSRHFRKELGDRTMTVPLVNADMLRDFIDGRPISTAKPPRKNAAKRPRAPSDSGEPTAKRAAVDSSAAPKRRGRPPKNRPTPMAVASVPTLSSALDSSAADSSTSLLPASSVALAVASPEPSSPDTQPLECVVMVDPIGTEVPVQPLLASSSSVATTSAISLPAQDDTSLLIAIDGDNLDGLLSPPDSPQSPLDSEEIARGTDVSIELSRVEAELADWETYKPQIPRLLELEKAHALCASEKLAVGAEIEKLRIELATVRKDSEVQKVAFEGVRKTLKDANDKLTKAAERRVRHRNLIKESILKWKASETALKDLKEKWASAEKDATSVFDSFREQEGLIERVIAERDALKEERTSLLASSEELRGKIAGLETRLAELQLTSEQRQAENLLLSSQVNQVDARFVCSHATWRQLYEFIFPLDDPLRPDIHVEDGVLKSPSFDELISKFILFSKAKCEGLQKEADDAAALRSSTSSHDSTVLQLKSQLISESALLSSARSEILTLSTQLAAAKEEIEQLKSSSSLHLPPASLVFGDGTSSVSSDALVGSFAPLSSHHVAPAQPSETETFTKNQIEAAFKGMFSFFSAQFLQPAQTIGSDQPSEVAGSQATLQPDHRHEVDGGDGFDIFSAGFDNTGLFHARHSA